MGIKGLHLSQRTLNKQVIQHAVPNPHYRHSLDQCPCNQ